MGQKIIVGLSGGVDSSVTAWRLQQQGHEVEALFMKNWQDDEECPAEQDMLDAQRVCDRLGIRLHTVNFSQEYWHHVFDHFLTEYRAGRTPNPDILCNKEIKFKAFLDYAKTLGADKIATGHYAAIEFDQQSGEYALCCAQDKNKDQTYFLYTLKQAQLSQSCFPLGEFDKTEVRKIAKQLQLTTHDKKDSTGICFIGERKFRDFLTRYLPAKPGLIKTLEGEVIGEHQGVMYYTHGQRQGLGIGGLQQSQELPWYVAKKDIHENVLYVVQGHEHPALLQSDLLAKQCEWVGAVPKEGESVLAKVRYRQPAQVCTVVKIDDESMSLQFQQPQWAVTPGQSVVLYQQHRCLGGGVIV